MNRLFTWMDTLQIPVWAFLLGLWAFLLGRVWQSARNRRQMNRMMDIIVDLTETCAYQGGHASPLAQSMINFRRSLEGVGSALDHPFAPSCQHGDHPDDCPVCRH